MPPSPTVDIFDLLCEEFREESDRPERKCKDTSEWTEPDRFDHDDRNNELVERARDGNDAATDIVDWLRREVIRSHNATGTLTMMPIVVATIVITMLSTMP